jgi:hypothetical protein
MKNENSALEYWLIHLIVYCQADKVLNSHKDQVLLVNAFISLPNSDFQFAKIVEVS